MRWTIGPAQKRRTNMIRDVHTRNSVPNVGLLRTVRMISAIQLSVPNSVVASSTMTSSNSTKIGCPKLLTYMAKSNVGMSAIASCAPMPKSAHPQSEDLVETGDQEKAHHEAAASAEFTQHVEVRALWPRRAPAPGILLEENQSISDRRQEHQSGLPLPQPAGHTGGIDVAHRNREEPAEHQTARPSRVQNIEVPRFFAGEKRRGHGIHYCFDRAVTERKNESPDIEQREAGLLPGQHRLRTRARTRQQEGRRQSNDRGKHMQA